MQVIEAKKSFNLFGSWTTAAICILFLLATLSVPAAQIVGECFVLFVQ